MQSRQSGRPHVGLIMDGNGRWARARGLPRAAGHRAGVEAIRPVVEAAREAGVGTLTLYAFSSDNWRRPPAEVRALMALLDRYLEREAASFAAAGVRLTLIGRRDRLAARTRERIASAEQETAAGDRMHLRIAFDYSARDTILAAAAQAGPRATREDFQALLAGDGAPDVDLLIRTGGEQRLSDFLLWESAYAELLFVERMWPDYAPEDLAAALAQFANRQRRFGALAPAARAA